MRADLVGPYDEVIWIPGSYETPPLEGTRMVRISRIYVSTVESVYNGGYSPDICIRVNTDAIYSGRRNWNIPKEVQPTSIQCLKYYTNMTARPFQIPPHRQHSIPLPPIQKSRNLPLQLPLHPLHLHQPNPNHPPLPSNPPNLHLLHPNEHGHRHAAPPAE